MKKFLSIVLLCTSSLMYADLSPAGVDAIAYLLRYKYSNVLQQCSEACKDADTETIVISAFTMGYMMAYKEMKE